MQSEHIEQTQPVKPTAATYVCRKWEVSTPAPSPVREYIYCGSRRRVVQHRKFAKFVGHTLAFLNIKDMSVEDKMRTVYSVASHPDEYTDLLKTEYTSNFSINNNALAIAVVTRDHAVQRKFLDVMQTASNKIGHTWMPAPWDSEWWFAQSNATRLHFVHISEEDPLQIAYADSLDKLMADRWTRTKPGRYLTKFFDHVLDENQIRTWTERVQAMAAPADLKFAASDDPDEWVRVYANGPSSCMAGDSSVRVYAHDKSVLRLAYLTSGNTITARCIVREDTKEYIRPYPNTTSSENTRWHMAMRERLESQGYTHGGMGDVLLAAERVNRWDNSYVCPYIDSGNDIHMSASLVVRDGKEYLLLSRDGDWDAQQTDGVLNGRQCTCPDCGDSYDDDDDFIYIESRGDSICQDCVDRYYTPAYVSRHNQEYVSNDDVIYCESDGENYHMEYANQADIYCCEVTGDWYHIDDLCMTSRGLVHNSRCTGLAVPDSDGNTYAFVRDTATTHDGRTIHELDAEIRDDGLVYHEDDPVVETKTETEGE
jgi:hypothetical protein